MTEPFRAGLRMALATACTAFAVAALHVPQPFLAVLAAQLTAGIGFGGRGGFAGRIAAAWAGSLGRVLLLAAAPDQQWVSIPLFAAGLALGSALTARHLGPAPAILFAMGFCGMFAAGIVYPAAGLATGAAHAASLTIAAASTVLAAAVCPGMEDASPPPVRAGGLPDVGFSHWQVGISATLALIAACAALPNDAVVASIAAAATAISLPPGARGGAAKVAGSLLGTAAAVGFLTVVTGAGNDLAIFLLPLAALLGGFGWLASVRPAQAAAFRQAGAMFAVVATVLPHPQATFADSIARAAAVMIGLFAALLVRAAAACQRPSA
jgi:hypothetical protein